MKNIFKGVILASASPRRKELLGLIFEDFQICVSNVEEKISDNLTVFEQPENLSLIKGRAVAKKFPDHLVIAADTCVFLQDEILGKPKDSADAKAMLNSLSNTVHKVITGCSLFWGNKVKSFSFSTDVEFYPLSETEIDDYILSGDPFDKAGAYGIQTGGALFVKEIKGDYYNVVGLPVAELKRQIEEFIK